MKGNIEKKSKYLNKNRFCYFFRGRISIILVDDGMRNESISLLSSIELKIMNLIQKNEINISYY